VLQLGNMPLRTKLFAATLGVASLGIVSGALLLAVRHRESLRAAALEDAKVLAATVAEYAAGALVFDDAAGATDILAKLRQSGAVTDAVLFDDAARAFATYGRPPGAEVRLTAAERARQQASFAAEGQLVALQPVTHLGAQIGTLRIASSTQALEAQLMRDTASLLIESLFLIAICAFFAARLSRFIAEPILRLSEVMRRVGDENLLSVRVEAPSEDEIGRLYHGFNAMLDQIRERANERDLSEARVRAMVRAMPDTVFVIDERGRYVEVLTPDAKLAPRRLDVLVGATLFDGLSDATRERMRAEVSAAVLGQETTRIDYELETTASTRFVEAALAPLEMRTKDGLCTLLVVARDVSERRALEEQLLQSHKLEAVGQLAGGIAHDFNNLLAGIMGYAELLRMPSPGRSVPQIADEIVRVSEHAAQLTSRLLGFARKSKAQSTPTDLSEVVSRVTGMLERTLDRRISVKHELCLEGCVIEGDAAQLESAVLNLGLNARDAMPQGGTLTFGTRRVTLDRLPPDCAAGAEDGRAPFVPGDYVQVSVADTGDGITPELRERIFEPFFTTKSAGKGSGLGLAAVADSMRAHQGFVSIDSEAGRGTVFRLFVPALRQSRTERVSPVTPSVVEPVRCGGHVLVVDDEPALREIERSILQELGYRVTAASNGREALECIAATPDLDLLILDMVMPEVSGAEVAARLRHLRPGLPIIIASGYNMTTDGEVHADGFLQKPFTSRELARTVAEVLSRRRALAPITEEQRA